MKLIPACRPKNENSLMLWRLSCLIVGLIAVAAVTTSDVKVLHNKYNSQTVWIYCSNGVASPRLMQLPSDRT